jgi:hypothetical protein
MSVARIAGLLMLLGALSGCATIEGPSGFNAGGRACDGPAAYAPAALYNAAAQRYLAWSPFGRAERGWEIYEPRIMGELGVSCSADTAGFAAALARWQWRRDLSPDGALKPVDFEVMKAGWQAKRPFVRLRQAGVCPDPPAESALATAAPGDSLDGRPIQLRRRALKAYRRMVAAARRALPELASDPDALRLFSGYRSPAYDAARCAHEANCDGLVRAACSSHRTGLALDLDVGAAPGRAVDSSADENRLFQSRTAAYRWLVANARRYGFVNYGFEPWHWEWTGEAA